MDWQKKFEQDTGQRMQLINRQNFTQTIIEYFTWLENKLDEYKNKIAELKKIIKEQEQWMLKK